MIILLLGGLIEELTYTYLKVLRLEMHSISMLKFELETAGQGSSLYPNAQQLSSVSA